MDEEIQPGIYRHYKGGLYLVYGYATHSETKESFVVYQALQCPAQQFWVRPAAMFQEQIVVAGVKVPRFRFIK